MTTFRCSYPVLAWLLSLVMLACASPRESGSSSDRARIAELEKENAELRETVEELEARITVITSHGDVSVDPAYPKVDAFVLNVDREQNLVVLNQGKNDGVEIGFVFTLYRGSTFKGLVRITEVQPGMSTGLILNEKNAIATGDSATTVL